MEESNEVEFHCEKKKQLINIDVRSIINFK